MLNKISAVLFDLDGTFLDTAPDLALALNIVLEKHRFPTLPFSEIRPWASTGTRGLLNLGFGIDDSNPKYPLLREQFLQAYHEHINDRTQIFPGIKSLLQHLAKNNLAWGIVTNKPADLATQLLNHFKLTESCACIIGGDTLAKRKPDPEPLLHACELMGKSTQQCVYVGDAERDIEAAKRANMVSIAALYGYIAQHEDPRSWAADYYINHPQEIISWLKF